MSKRDTIAALIICCNEENKIRRCLESVQFCDEIIIVDSGSSDDTLEICGEFTNKIFHHPWKGFVKQKGFALSQASSDWIINLDADEEVSVELRDEIVQKLEQAASGTVKEHGFEVLRTVYHLGKWWKKGGWFPEYRLRVCKRDHTTWGGDDPHEKALVGGKVGRLSHELRHYTYDNLENQIRSLNTFSSTAAQTLQKKGQVFRLRDLFFRPLIRFLKFYIIKKGFLEGFPGLAVGVIEAFYVFLKYLKLWELERVLGKGATDAKTK